MAQLFGFEIKRKEPENLEVKQKTFAIPQNDDGALTIQTGSYYGTYVDLDGIVRSESELITRYRDMAETPELEGAIMQIVNEAIVTDEKGKCVDIVMDDLKQPASIKNKIKDEFKYILKLLNFSNNANEIFKRWYIDGRVFYHLVIDETKPHEGIKELRYIDPRRIRKIREVQKVKDAVTGLEIIKAVKEYFLYNDRGMMGATTHIGQRIAVDSIVNINSGLMDSRRSMVLSYLHKAIKPLNQLRMVEDATVIYRLSRAPERRIFYVDVGNMPTLKADQYLRDQMVKYRNRLVYDANTGEVRDDRKYMAMLEDFWLPRREGNRSTEITTLQGGQNLGKIEDVEYFQRKLYDALDIPYSRTPGARQQGSSIVGLGRPAEVTRDELAFAKFIDQLRNKFSSLFDEILKVQVLLKGICTAQEWDDFIEEIYFDFLEDIEIKEMKESEILAQRAGLIAAYIPYAPPLGGLVSLEWIRKKIMRFTDDEIKEIDEQIKKEKEDIMAAAPKDDQGNPLPIDPNTGLPLPQEQQPQGPATPPQDVSPLDSEQIDQSQQPAAAGAGDFQKKQPNAKV